jgi:D-arabinose 1-dehydrogenase-like Zn-dependent alcohol dehydrogenase
LLLTTNILQPPFAQPVHPNLALLFNLFMKAVVYDAPRKFEYRDIPVPKIQPDEILLQVHACGVCGTDLHVHEGEFGPRFPLTPGHEFSGEIVELGSAVTWKAEK